MEQMSLFEMSYKYIIDTSSILSQKPNESNRRKVYKSLWDNIDTMIKEKTIITCSEVFEEIKDESIKAWIKAQQCSILEIDNTIQYNVRKIVTENPKMIEFSGKTGSSSGDAFLIATAMAYHLTVITEENKNSPYKIPMICQKYNIESVNIVGLSEREGWVF